MSAGPPQDATAEFVKGTYVGPYTIEAVLGVGGMGRVYEAVGAGGERVALKVVKRDLARDTVFRRRFDREASIAQRVSHRHVVPVLDRGEHDGVPYLAQRLIRGGSLAEKIEREGTLDIETAVKICLWVAAGLDAVHQAGLVHRDVKPANILLDEGGIAYITDFGLAKDSQASVLTRPGQALGSLDYMAPEQIRGEEVTAATDVYALGCVMTECLCGTPPFGDRQGMRVLWAHLKDEPPDPCASRAELSHDLSMTIRIALEKDAAKRPPTATAYARLVQIAAGVSSGPRS
ncbi:MAG: serine/threonine kinase PknH [Thermoleophilaceae bacterium]|jgi:serine/threonine-protein kinase|nr:serine/threonine kinase PknH [Thermoleophilaceae bacterium]